MFDRQCGEVSVVDQIAAGADRPEKIADEWRVASGRVEDDGGGLAEPGVDAVHRLVDRQWRLEEALTRGKSNEGEERNPSKADGNTPRERIVEPGSRLRMVGRVLVDGVEENVGVDELHEPVRIFRTSSSSSISAASCTARSRFTRDRPIRAVAV